MKTYKKVESDNLWNIVLISFLHITFSIVAHNVFNSILVETSKTTGINLIYLNFLILGIVILTVWNMNDLDIIGSVNDSDKTTGNKRKIKKIFNGFLGVLFWVAAWPLIENVVDKVQDKYKLNPTVYYLSIMALTFFGLTKFHGSDVLS